MRWDLYTIRDAPGGKCLKCRPRWYHILMKWFYALVAIAASLPAAVNPQLKQVTTVYILSMRSGMDQFLANQLTASGIFQVVTDPQKADAILTDRVGESFESKLKDLYPPPAPPKPDKDAKDDKKKDKDDSDTPVARVSGAIGGKGTFFLVDRKSRTVLWSIYERPKDSSPHELSKTAEKVVRRLKDDLADKKQPSS
jgi:hypothetical protein